MFGFVARSALVVGIVGVVSFSMPIAAQADTTSDLLSIAGVAVVGGGLGVESAAGATAGGFACAAALPVCIGVGAAVVGVALYGTKDTWIPWFQNGYEWITGANVGWSTSPLSYRVRVNAATTSAALVVDSEKWDNPNWWEVPMFVGPKIVGTVYCQNGPKYVEQGWGVSDANGGQSNYYFRDKTAAQTTPFTVTMNLCSGAGEAPMLGFTGAAEAAPAGSLVWGNQAPLPGTGSVISAEVQCVRPDGTQFAVTAAVPATNDLVKIPACPAGSKGKCATLSGGAPGSLVVQGSTCAAAAAADTLYPDCKAGVTTPCAYQIQVDGVPCTVGGVCRNWAGIYTTDPSRVRCKFGHYVVAVADCAFLERVYETGTVPATTANTDGLPDTYTSPGPAGQPDSKPGTSSGTSPATATEPPPLPVPAPIVGPTPDEWDCWPNGWAESFTPGSWVFKPIKCALRWAFVPSVTALNTDAIKNELDRAGVAPSIAALSTAVGSLGGSAGGCSGPSINFDIRTVHQVIRPFDACTAPMSTVASYAYALISVVVVIGGAGKIISLLGHAFGYGAPAPTWQQGTLF